MRKPGRPKKNGLKPFWMFFRVGLVLNAYNQARSAGLKHSCAVTETVAAVKKRVPGMRISETGVKRVLAEFQRKGAPVVFRVTDTSRREGTPLPDMVTTLMGVPPGSRMHTALAFGFGPRPEYPRINARAPR